MRLGCVADDYTGGTDVAAALRRAGLRTVLLFGAPAPGLDLPDCDAVVVALKTRTVPATDAVRDTLTVVDWFARHGIERTYFKYCSTFDSTDDGNIGPVTDALLDRAGETMTLICPASPEHGRTVYQGHLFVNGTLLSESSMRHHPLTPMTDSDLVRVLSRQTKHPVGLLPLNVVRSGREAVATHLAGLRSDGIRHVVVDATQDTDLIEVAAATPGPGLLTGGAGLAGAWGRLLAGDVPPDHGAVRRPVTGPAVVLAGSCSAATLEQVAHAQAFLPAHRLDPATIPDPGDLLRGAVAHLDEHLGRTPVLIYSSAPADQRVPGAAELLEHTLGAVAAAAVERGARRIVVAGGETSGAVVNALGIGAVVVGAEADPGVPWCHTIAEPEMSLLLKSGNFGGPDLLVRASKEDHE